MAMDVLVLAWIHHASLQSTFLINEISLINATQSLFLFDGILTNKSLIPMTIIKLTRSKYSYIEVYFFF